MAFEPNTEELLVRNREYAERFHHGDLAVSPKRRLAVVACMDSRMDVFQILGLDNGEAHIVRNAGGVITDDVVRSLCLSQRLLGTREIVLLHHTDCGLQQVDEAEFTTGLESEFGMKPPWAIESFSDPYLDVAQSIRRLRLTPFVSHEQVRGFVYDVTTGLVHEVRGD